MRRLSLRLLPLLLVICVVFVPVGCKKKRKRTPVTVSTDGTLATMVQVADPRAAVQLVKGFYPVESDSWRWTAGAFAVSLRPPRNGAQNGANLVFKFVLPDAVLQKVHSLQLSAKVNGLSLAPEKYARAGEQTYTRDVPASALTSDVVSVDFTLDKFLPPSPSDQRELGVIASSVGFEAK